MNIDINRDIHDLSIENSYNYIKEVLNLLEEKYSNIDPNRLFNVIKRLYNITLDDNDYLEYVNYTTNKNYDKVVDVKTSYVFSDIQSEGHGRDFSWWTVKYRLLFKAVTTKDFNAKKVYSYEELKELVDTDKVVLVNRLTKEVSDTSRVKQDERFLNLKHLAKNNYEVNVNDIDPKNECFIYFMNQFRKNKNKTQLFRDVKSFAFYIKEDVEHLLNMLCVGYDDDEIEECKKYIEFYDETFKGKSSYTRKLK